MSKGSDKLIHNMQEAEEFKQIKLFNTNNQNSSQLILCNVKNGHFKIAVEWYYTF